MQVDAILFKSTLQDIFSPAVRIQLLSASSIQNILLASVRPGKVMSATTTVLLTSSLRLQKGKCNASKVARFGNEFCKLFQVLLVFVVEAVFDSTVDVDNGDNLV